MNDERHVIGHGRGLAECPALADIARPDPGAEFRRRRGPVRGDWMQTFSGRQYWPLDPRPTDVSIDDIAHHLAMICRFCGACTRHYSVAEHSVYVSRLVPPELMQRALLHDAAEAYCNDIVKPIKRDLLGYAAIEAANESAIFRAFNLPMFTADEHAEIKRADHAILLAEQAVIMRPAPAKWSPLDVPPEMRERALAMLRAAVAPVPPGAKYTFLARWRELTEGT